VYGYGLDPGQVDAPPSYPTAALPARRRPWLPLLAVLAVLLVAGGVVAAVLLTGTDNTVTVQAPPAQGGPSIQDGVNQIAAILDLSAQGRTATQNGDFATAVANRQQVLDQVNKLVVAPELEQSRLLLGQAIQQSLLADQQLEQCATCASTAAADQQATALKESFVSAFNPWATKYLQRSYDANSL
jgi:hypothetical protein